MNIFTGLHSYEIILLVLGGILFLVLTFALIWYIIKNKKITPLLPFFLIPIVMIGYSSIKSVSYDNGKIAVEKNSTEVKNNPSDSVARKELQESIQNLDSSRIEKDTAALVAVAEAHQVLGNYDTALIYINKSLAIDPTNAKALQIKSGIENNIRIKNNFNEKVNLLNSKLQVFDDSAKEMSGQNLSDIRRTVAQVEIPEYADERSLLTISKALAAINEKQKALEVVEKVIESKRWSADADTIKQQIIHNEFKTALKRDTTLLFKNMSSDKLDNVVITKKSSSIHP